jgi:hypothetical protein
VAHLPRELDWAVTLAAQCYESSQGIYGIFTEKGLTAPGAPNLRHFDRFARTVGS